MILTTKKGVQIDFDEIDLENEIYIDISDDYSVVSGYLNINHCMEIIRFLEKQIDAFNKKIV
tara:strand:- start:246 stop:431 length:186 start_codon:yes stop_codon:yes gene_type:complete